MLRSLATGLALFALAAPSGAAVVYVGNDGLDGEACGTKTAPCRSIAQGIARAAAGDTVLVGPGRYGDLDADGIFGEPGEENASVGIVRVDEAVRVISRDGAAATFIEGTQELEDPGTPLHPVRLEAAGAVLGARDHGFTIVSHRNREAVVGEAAGVRIEGNVVIDGLAGYVAAGSTILDSRAFAAGRGFDTTGASRVERNAAVRNGTGFLIQTPGRLLRSIAVGNSVGVNASGSVVLVSAIGNDDGFEVNHPVASVDRANAYGNDDCPVDSLFPLGRVFFGATPGAAPPEDPNCNRGTATPAKRELRVRLRPIR